MNVKFASTIFQPTFDVWYRLTIKYLISLVDVVDRVRNLLQASKKLCICRSSVYTLDTSDTPTQNNGLPPSTHWMSWKSTKCNEKTKQKNKLYFLIYVLFVQSALS